MDENPLLTDQVVREMLLAKQRRLEQLELEMHRVDLALHISQVRSELDYPFRADTCDVPVPGPSAGYERLFENDLMFPAEPAATDYEPLPQWPDEDDLQMVSRSPSIEVLRDDYAHQERGQPSRSPAHRSESHQRESRTRSRSRSPNRDSQLRLPISVYERRKLAEAFEKKRLEGGSSSSRTTAVKDAIASSSRDGSRRDSSRRPDEREPRRSREREERRRSSRESSQRRRDSREREREKERTSARQREKESSSSRRPESKASEERRSSKTTGSENERSTRDSVSKISSSQSRSDREREREKKDRPTSERSRSDVSKPSSSSNDRKKRRSRSRERKRSRSRSRSRERKREYPVRNTCRVYPAPSSLAVPTTQLPAPLASMFNPAPSLMPIVNPAPMMPVINLNPQPMPVQQAVPLMNCGPQKPPSLLSMDLRAGPPPQQFPMGQGPPQGIHPPGMAHPGFQPPQGFCPPGQPQFVPQQSFGPGFCPPQPLMNPNGGFLPGVPGAPQFGMAPQMTPMAPPMGAPAPMTPFGQPPVPGMNGMPPPGAMPVPQPFPVTNAVRDAAGQEVDKFLSMLAWKDETDKRARERRARERSPRRRSRERRSRSRSRQRERRSRSRERNHHAPSSSSSHSHNHRQQDSPDIIVIEPPLQHPSLQKKADNFVPLPDMSLLHQRPSAPSLHPPSQKKAPAVEDFDEYDIIFG